MLLLRATQVSFFPKSTWGVLPAWDARLQLGEQTEMGCIIPNVILEFCHIKITKYKWMDIWFVFFGCSSP